MTLQQAMVKWLTLYKRPVLKQTSYDTLFRTCRNYIFKIFGDKEIKEINSDDIQEYLIDLQYSQEKSYSTAKKVHDALNDFYQHALDKGIVEDNIVKAVKCKNLQRNKYIKPRSFTLEEVQRFITAATLTNNYGDNIYHYGPLLVVYLHTGLRLGELIGAKINDYDPATGRLAIHGNIEVISNYDSKGILISGVHTIYQDTPKTKDSIRVIFLNKTAQKYLYPYYVHSLRCNSDFLITLPSGKQVSPSSVQSTYQYVVKRANIYKGKGVHTLRHTCATHLLDDETHEVDIKMVSKVLGHASVKVTYDKYIHTDDFHNASTLNTLDSRFSFS